MVHAQSVVVLTLCTALLGLSQAHQHVHYKSALDAQSIRTSLNRAARIQLSTTDMVTNGQSVVVTVSGVHRPHVSDILALYAGATAAVQETIPVYWNSVAPSNPDYVTTGSARMTFRLLNFRQDFIVRLLRNTTTPPVTVRGESSVITNHLKEQPSQVHLALHADGSSMVAQWNSGSQEPQTVQYNTLGVGLPTRAAGWQAAAAVKQAASAVLTYTADMLCGKSASGAGWLDPGYMHQALIPLASFPPNTRVYYRVGSPDVGWSDTFSFTTPPPPGGMGTAGGGAAFKFLMFADVGQVDPVLWTTGGCNPHCSYRWEHDYAINSTLLVPRIAAEPDVQLALLLGDLSYAVGYAADWDVFGHQFQPAFSKWPVMAVPGNHERDEWGTGAAMAGASSDSGGECNVPYTYRFYTPAATLWARQTAGSLIMPTTTTSSSSSSSRRQGTPPPRRPPPAAATAGVAAGRHLASASSTTSSSSSKQGQSSSQGWAPRPGPLDPWRAYYAFAMGPVAYIMVDTDTPSDQGSPQWQYVADQLAQVDRSIYPWLLVGMHRMMLSPSVWSGPVTGDPENMERLRRDFEELFNRYGVDLVLFGHDHEYSRSCPYRNGSCVPTDTRQVRLPIGSSDKDYGCPNTRYTAVMRDQEFVCEGKMRTVDTHHNAPAPVYILSGNAGAQLQPVFAKEIPSTFPAADEWTHGYMRLTATRTSLLAEAVASWDGSLIDAVQLVKRASGLKPEAGQKGLLSS